MNPIKRTLTPAVRVLAALGGLVLLCGVLGCPGESDEPETAAQGQAPAASWPMFHGRQDMTGVAAGRLPAKLVLRWKLKTGGAVKSSPAIELAPDDPSGATGRVFIGSNDGSVYAIDLADGKKLWDFKTADAVEAPPLVHEGAVYVGSVDGYLYALDAATGAMRWKYQTEGKILGGANRTRSPQGDRTWILIGSYDMKLHCLDAATGKAAWSVETSNYVNDTPALADGKVIFGGCDGQIRLLSPTDGRELAALNAGGYVAGSPVLVGGRIYAANYEEKLFCFDLATGKTLWEYPGEDSGFYSSPAISSDRLVIGGLDHKVHCVSRETGKALWTFATRRQVESSPAICGNKVVVGSNDGRLYLLSLADGKLLWSYEIGRDVTSSPAVAGGWVVVGSDDGYVYAFGAKR
jgi:outer membrane protein assembly factor BamB